MSAKQQLLASYGGASGYQISRSLRSRSSASAHMTRAGFQPSGTSWAFSFWQKKGSFAGNFFNAVDTTLGLQAGLLSAGNVVGDLDFYLFTSAGGGTYPARKCTNRVLRDPSAWYHIMYVWDSANATAADRMRIYVNGVRETSFAFSTDPTLNFIWYWATPLSIAPALFSDQRPGPTFNNPTDGYWAEMQFIDGGGALDPTSFGAANSTTGVWGPKKYTGTYGTHGFYLDFSDNSAATASTIGADRSGNGNNWTPSGISITAGVTNDSLVDTPTNFGGDTGLGGEVRSNYATLNPLVPLSSGTTRTFSNGNLTMAGNAVTGTTTLPITNQKIYWEIIPDAAASTGSVIGLVSAVDGAVQSAGGYGWDWKLGRKWINGSMTTVATSSLGHVIGFAYDPIVGTLDVRDNNVLAFQITGIPAGTYYPAANGAGSVGADQYTFNFGQRPFTYTAPTDFKALCTQNLSAPVIVQPSKFFDTTTFVSTGTTQNVVNSGGMQPDWIWFRDRGVLSNNYIFDSSRGASNYLRTDITAAEGNNTVFLTSFNSNGFSMGTGNYTASDNIVAWQWKKGVTAGFDIVTYTGNGTAGHTINHSLGVKPAMLIALNRSTAQNHAVWHQAIPSTGGYILLDDTGVYAAGTVSGSPWNGVDPTSSLFTTSASVRTNESGSGFVVYAFAEVPGFSKFSSYVGNGSADGPFTYCGFRPKRLMIKRIDSTSDWYIWDGVRSPINMGTLSLSANSSAVEDTTNSFFDLLSNGFKIRGSSANTLNASGGVYIYAAFAETPFNYSRAR